MAAEFILGLALGLALLLVLHIIVRGCLSANERADIAEAAAAERRRREVELARLKGAKEVEAAQGALEQYHSQGTRTARASVAPQRSSLSLHVSHPSDYIEVTSYTTTEEVLEEEVVVAPVLLAPGLFIEPAVVVSTPVVYDTPVVFDAVPVTSTLDTDWDTGSSYSSPSSCDSSSYDSSSGSWDNSSTSSSDSGW
ncbi:hypothetical protein [Aquabacterium sp.]|uniref:hypothetical protein n=1 Tax=Aquabacterium sp. TaxID=1872578 RepID=UPI0040380408